MDSHFIREVDFDSTFSLGQEFQDVKTLRNAIKEAAIAQHFELRIIKSDLIRYFAKCASDGCPWRLRAAKLPNLPTFKITSLQGTHTCGRNVKHGHHQASIDWVVSFIQERLRKNVNYKPNDILDDIYKHYGIVIPYKQAWRAKERGLAAIYGSSEQGYCHLPSYCDQIKRSNPGSFAQLYTTVKRKFPSSSHALCMRHLTGCIGKDYTNSRLVLLLWEAAYATNISTFKEKMAEIHEISSDAAKWIEQFPTSHWALVYFQGTRYGQLSSNITEFFNNWIIETLELPIIQVIEGIHNKLMTEFEERRLKANSCYSTLAPSAEKRIMEAISISSTFQVLQSDEVKFEVWSTDRSEIVNIGIRSCSCRDWQLYGIPCPHAVAALIYGRKDVYAFAENCFSVTSFRQAYAMDIHNTNGIEDPANKNNDQGIVGPPKFRRPPGRPEKKRVCVEDFNREKHSIHCSRCNRTGHNKTTCKA
ncbi:hypothetical protein ACFE04_022421 [Oxalis oulophora]